jgi:hypothetical protein
MTILKNKKGWLKIVEAFIAVMLILATLLILLARQNSSSEMEKEITLLQTSILSSISKDEALRDEILTDSSPLTQTKAYVKGVIPSWLDFRVQVCESGVICALTDVAPEVIASREIYSQNILIVATINNNQPKQLKLFLWRK